MYRFTRLTLFNILFSLLSLGSTQAQLTLKISALPANTPANATIYAAGNFNNWNSGNAAHTLTRQADGSYSLTITPANGTVEYKFTRGSWATVEGNATGTFRPNRTVVYDGTPKTETLTVLSWEDLGGTGGSAGGTAAANVTILNNAFGVPQLNKTRRIWLYLPPDYASATNKRYPVLYMHDGQNLFDARTSFSGEWQVDESLNALFSKGDYGCIVVGIDNGGGSRLDEYSPWVNQQYGGGQGDEYVDFIVNTLKPYIDAQYRTLPERRSTAIMGSSMGGLVSMYAFSERQDVFSKAGILSPAFWFAGQEPANHAATHPRKGAGRVYFLAGGAEPASVTTNMRAVADALRKAGFQDSEIQFKNPSDGQHAEWFWAREFPAAYHWLFADAVTSTKTPRTAAPMLKVFPNPGTDVLRWSLEPAPANNSKVKVQVLGTEGRIWQDTTMRSNEPIAINTLPAGIYTVRIQADGKTWQHTWFVKQ
jgi:predicted alpha/beta superfamily hydrolase